MKTYDLTKNCHAIIQAANESNEAEHERFIVVNMVLNTPKRKDIQSLFHMVHDTKGRPVLEVVR